MSTSYCIIEKKECKACEYMKVYDSSHRDPYHCYHPSRSANPAIRLAQTNPSRSCKLFINK